MRLRFLGAFVLLVMVSVPTVDRARADDYDCADFATQSEAQDFFERHEPADDYYHLDSDGDGIACEWNPDTVPAFEPDDRDYAPLQEYPEHWDDPGYEEGPYSPSYLVADAFHQAGKIKVWQILAGLAGLWVVSIIFGKDKSGS